MAAVDITIAKYPPPIYRTKYDDGTHFMIRITKTNRTVQKNG